MPSCLVGLSSQRLASQLRFGMECRGRYEIDYITTPAAGGNRGSQEGMLATVNVLRQRTDSIGMAEPAIQIEGENHFRVKLAGLESAWDKAEEKAQPMRLDNCKAVEKALDRALAKVCSGQTDRKECITALKTV